MSNLLERTLVEAADSGGCTTVTRYVPAREAYCYSEEQTITAAVWVCDGSGGGIEIGGYHPDCTLSGYITYTEVRTVCVPARDAYYETVEVCTDPASGLVPPADWRGSAQSVDVLEGPSVYRFTAYVVGGIITGLKDGDADWQYRHPTDIQFGFRLFGAAASVYESGVYGDTFAVSQGDTFEIRRWRERIEYYHNDVLIHTSETPASGQYRAAAFLYTVGDVIDDPVFELADFGTVEQYPELPRQIAYETAINYVAQYPELPQQQLTPEYFGTVAQYPELPRQAAYPDDNTGWVAQYPELPQQLVLPDDLNFGFVVQVPELPQQDGLGIPGQVGSIAQYPEIPNQRSWDADFAIVTQYPPLPVQSSVQTTLDVEDAIYSVIPPIEIAAAYGTATISASRGYAPVVIASAFGQFGAEAFIDPVQIASASGTALSNEVWQSSILPVPLASASGTADSVASVAWSVINPVPLASASGEFGAEAFIDPVPLASASGSAQPVSIWTGAITSVQIASASGTAVPVSVMYSDPALEVVIASATGYAAGIYSVIDPVPLASAYGRIVPQATRVTYVVNLAHNAVTRYTVGFVRFARIGNRHYGLGEDGVLYLLDGDTYDGDDIAAEVVTYPTDLGSPFRKRVTKAYADARTAGAMTIVAVVDETAQNTVATIHEGDGVRNHPFKPGRGLVGQRWAYGVQSTDDFTLSGFHVLYQPLSRRV